MKRNCSRITIGRVTSLRGVSGFIQGWIEEELHPGVELGANLKSISHRCNPEEVAFVWKLTKETIHWPLGCLQDGFASVHYEMLR